MAELNLCREHLRAGSNSPSDNRLLDLALLDCIDNTVFLDATDLAKEDEQLALRILLVSEQVIDERGSRVAITTDGNTLVSAIGIQREDIVQLIRHATRLRNITNGAWAVELGCNNVIHHPS